MSASMQRHFGAAQQQAAAAQPSAETKQTAPAQHSLLHRGASLDHRQSPAATLLSGLLVDPMLAAVTRQIASNAASQTKTAAAPTYGVPAQPPLPQQWATSNYTPSQMSAQLAYAAFVLHMNMCGAPPLETAIGLVFPPDALQHQLDQQFMRHAHSRCQLTANPDAPLPYSQLLEAPDTWRAAVLGLIDWLVEVHHQGIVEGDLGAKQHRALLLCTVGKAGKVQVQLASMWCILWSPCCMCSMQTVGCSWVLYSGVHAVADANIAASPRSCAHSHCLMTSRALNQLTNCCCIRYMSYTANWHAKLWDRSSLYLST